MARQDDILKSFLEHEILKTKYNLKPEDLIDLVRNGVNSESPIIKAISLIVVNLEAPRQITDNALRDIILQHLNQSAI